MTPPGCLRRLRTHRHAAGFVVVEEIFAEVFQRNVGSLSVHEILEMIPHESLHFFQAQAGIGRGGNDGSVIGHTKEDRSGFPAEARRRYPFEPLALYYLRPGPLRFGELRRRIPEATQKMLTQTLRELEKDGLVLREVYPQVPPKVVYSLTRYGRTLEPILRALCAWGEKDFKRRKA